MLPQSREGVPAVGLQALIFDVDGTLAETEEGHRKAFNQAFTEAGLSWRWDRRRYSELLAVSGGKERIRRFVADEDPTRAGLAGYDEWVLGLHRAKTAAYLRLMAGGEIELRPGVARLIREAHTEGLRLAIATTTTGANVTALFEATLGTDWLSRFEVVAAAEQAPTKKPDPSVYQWVLERLRLPADACLAIEDTHNGLLAASAIGIRVLVTPSTYSQDDDFGGALAVVSNLGEPGSPYRALGGDHGGPGWIDVATLHRWWERDRPL
jgi:HAD superfamily hydrolase (TIGR01509 family)